MIQTINVVSPISTTTSPRNLATKREFEVISYCFDSWKDVVLILSFLTGTQEESHYPLVQYHFLPPQTRPQIQKSDYHPSTMNKSQFYLQQCSDAASKSPMCFTLGAVLVKGGKIISTGYNHHR